MLIDTVRECSASFRSVRNMREQAASFNQFEKNVDSLSAFSQKIRTFISTTDAIEQSQFNIPARLTQEQKDNLVQAVSDAGMACKDLSLDKSHIVAINAAIDPYIAMVGMTWKSGISDEVNDVKSYLSVIMQLLDNKKEAENIIKMLDADVNDAPSQATVNRMELNIKKAHQIANDFQLTPEVRSFLEKVKIRRATFADVTPEVLEWITVNHLKAKLKIGF